MSNAATLKALRANWPYTAWRVTRGAIIPRLRWTDGPSIAAVNDFLCGEINPAYRFGRVLSDGALRVLGIAALARLGLEAAYLPPDEYMRVRDEDAPCWTVSEGYPLCNSALVRLSRWPDAWELDRLVHAAAFRYSFVKGDR